MRYRESGIVSMKGTRITLVGPLPPPSGGMANQTRQLARLLEAEGITVDLVQMNAPYRPAWIGQVQGLRAIFRLLPYLVDLWQAAGRSQLMHVMANSGWSWHLFAAPAVWIGWLRRVPVVVNYRGGEAESFFARSFAWIRPTLMRCAAVVVPSGFLQKVFSCREITAQIVPNIIDLNRFAAAPSRVSGESLQLLVARNLEPIYDIPTALRAFAIIRERFPHAHLTVAGSGPLLRDLERLTGDLGLTDSVTFTGRLDNERMADLFGGADLMLNPSLADNMPISVLESLACGVPVVSTNVGGVPFLVEDGRSALLVPPGDDQAMAGAALRVLGDPVLAGSLRDAGIEVVQQYTWPQVRERLFGVYKELLSGAQGTTISPSL